MNVNEMSDQEKTLTIIALMPEWLVWGHGGDGDDIIIQINGKGTACLQSPDYLYNEKWMFLAQKVLAWAHNHRDDLKMSVKGESTLAWFFAYTDGAETALNGVLALAIEAGMVETAVNEDGDK